MKKNKIKTKNYLAIFLIVVSILLIISLLIARCHFKNDTLDSNLCPKSSISSVTAILIDGTDVISETTRIDIINQINEIIDKTFTGGRIDVYIVDGNNAAVGSSSLSLCKPPDGSADVDGITSNPRQIKNLFDNRFIHPFKQKIDELLNTNRANSSPILESIQSISLKSYAKYHNVPKKLIIITDGLQHTDKISFYKFIPNWIEIKKTYVGSTLNCDLTNVDVELLIIQRQSNVESLGKIRQFFSDYCSDMGGELTRRYLLSGAN